MASICLVSLGCESKPQVLESDVAHYENTYGHPIIVADSIELVNSRLSIVRPHEFQPNTPKSPTYFAIFSRSQLVKVDINMLLATPRIAGIPAESFVDYPEGTLFVLQVDGKQVLDVTGGRVASIEVVAE